jgi:8-oxo-dGTP pyrophosphatase MutT (NUDIX family)
MTPTPTDLGAALGRHVAHEIPALPGRTNHLRAGVLVPLVWRAGRVEAMLTLRSTKLGRHAGEVAWPGGKPEPQDADLLATALREADEEVGARAVSVLGRLSSVPLYTSDFRLEPFVAQVAPAMVADGGEVVQLLPVDLGALLRAPHIDGIPWEWEDTRHLSPAWELAPGTVLFGGTAHVLLELLTVVAPAFGVPLPPLVPGRFSWSDVGLRAR